MQPQQSLTALPYIESASLLDYKSEGESGLESESEDEWTETHSKKKKMPIMWAHQ